VSNCLADAMVEASLRGPSILYLPASGTHMLHRTARTWCRRTIRAVWLECQHRAVPNAQCSITEAFPMPDRLPSLVLLVGFWVPPAVAGWTAAKVALQRSPHGGAGFTYTALATFVLAWSAAWFLFQVHRMPPYIPGATQDPTYAPPQAVAGLALVACALVLPGSAIASALAFRARARALRHTSASR